MKKKIALITGGSSGELEISLSSAAVIAQHLDKNQYDVYTVVIQGNDWIYLADTNHKVLIDKNDFSLTLNTEKLFFDCVFIAIHGTPGEDGKLQGYFDILGLPYTACDVYTSSLTFNKFFTNHLVENLGQKTGRLSMIRLGENFDSQIISKEIGIPCFVKPNKGGSSVGITKVMHENELAPAIENAFRYDDEVLVQQYLNGIEITCGLLYHNGELLVLPLCEVVSKKVFFDYEAKYTPGMAEEIIPARISDVLTKKCKEISSFLYKELNCKGIVRFDYMLVGEDYYFIEVNTIPGLSENSIVPKMARAVGISMDELFSMLIEEAIVWKSKRRGL
ncbi:MAG TPA: D-alanine--D-alanine ligase [Bacteroidales bacterium]|mgnify:CR=1 FL=1|nr:D-alanine--D-alanine ligase [Bacteroidales bacterium]